LLPAAAAAVEDADELAELVAWQLLHRWGIVFRDVYLKERLAVPWREVLWALRRLEARGLIRGGHFVTGVTGEQFAEEETLPLLRPRRAA
jgi:ATP-dependent Lhr-like helicase